MLTDAAWQRCYVHFLRNALDYLPRKADDDCLQELRWMYDRRDLSKAQRDLAAWLGRWSADLDDRVEWQLSVDSVSSSVWDVDVQLQYRHRQQAGALRTEVRCVRLSGMAELFPKAVRRTPGLSRHRTQSPVTRAARTRIFTADPSHCKTPPIRKGIVSKAQTTNVLV